MEAGHVIERCPECGAECRFFFSAQTERHLSLVGEPSQGRAVMSMSITRAEGCAHVENYPWGQ